MAASAGPLQGLSFGQILDRIFGLIRRNLRGFLLLGSVPAGGVLGFYAIAGGSLALSGAFHLPPHTPLQPRMLAWVVLGSLAGGLLMVASYTLFEAAATYEALATSVGIFVPFRSAYEMAWAHFARFLWLMILRMLLIGLPVALPFAVMDALTALALHSQGGQLAPGLWFLLFPLLVLLYVGAVLCAIGMGLRLSLAPSACIAEDVPAVTALKRSNQLTLNAKGRIFLVLLVVYAAGYLVMMVLELGCAALLGLGALAISIAHVRFAPPWSYIGIGALVVVGLALLLVWMAAVWSSYAVALAVLYHDQRYRTEGILPTPPCLETPEIRLRP